jgi:hypothetical protein
MADVMQKRGGLPGETQPAVVWASRIYRVGAISNFLVTVPAFVAYDRYVRLFTTEPPRYRFLVRIWSGMAFLWGVMFWEIAKDPRERYPMIKYSYLEKLITSSSVAVAFRSGEVPRRFLVGVAFTDIAWIPLFAWAQYAVRKAIHTAV